MGFEITCCLTALSLLVAWLVMTECSRSPGSASRVHTEVQRVAAFPLSIPLVVQALVDVYGEQVVEFSEELLDGRVHIDFIANYCTLPNLGFPAGLQICHYRFQTHAYAFQCMGNHESQ